MERVGTVVIGAGVIGLAIAAALARVGHSVVILEREADVGRGISARNSEVIHAGLHYAPGSLKDRLCRRGRDLLYARCEKRGIAHRRCGKLIVAVDDNERAALDAIARRGREAGVHDLRLLDAAEAQALEPALHCATALLSPSSGIVDARALMLSLLGEAEDHGAMLARVTAVERVAPNPGGGWRVRAAGHIVEADHVVNAAGLDAQRVAAMIASLDPALIPPRFLAKGHYFAYSGQAPFSRLIYPVPVAGGLGTHLTLDLGGQARFGPDIQWIEDEDYTVDPAHRDRFAMAARRFWPSIEADRLVPAYAGIRPKLVGPGEPDADFVIQGPAAHGLAGLVNLFGIESPGLTASLAIAEEALEIIGPAR